MKILGMDGKPFTRAAQDDQVIIRREMWDCVVDNAKMYKELFVMIETRLAAAEAQIRALELTPEQPKKKRWWRL